VSTPPPEPVDPGKGKPSALFIKDISGHLANPSAMAPYCWYNIAEVFQQKSHPDITHLALRRNLNGTAI